MTAVVKTNVPLANTGSSLAWGKWNSNPIDTIPSNTDGVTAFIAQGRDGSATGTEGTVTYQAGDGTIFTMYFDDPYSAANTVTISASGGSPLQYSYRVDFPASGREFTATFTIAHK